jgi:hypothetical protein
MREKLKNERFAPLGEFDRSRRVVTDSARAADREARFDPRLSLVRSERKRRPSLARVITYDFETENIKAGTPRPLYIAAYGEGYSLSSRIDSMPHLLAIIENNFLRDDLSGTKFVGWNANRFDAYFIAAAIIRSPSYRIRPYLTQSGALRGLLVTLAEDGDSRTARRWEFLDGMSMLGLPRLRLEKFLAVFAPDFPKLNGSVNFAAGEQFNPDDADHIAYCERDAEGLWHGVMRAQSIVYDEFKEPLRATIGASCIRILAAHIPEGVTVDPLPADALDTCRDYVLRGGYCYLVRPYTGPIWKYDLNQAYAAAMRESKLPAGGVLRHRGSPNLKSAAFFARITARNPRNKIPFYCRTMIGGRIKTVFATDSIPETWITDIEYRQLVAEKWQIECVECYTFTRSFSLSDYVNRLEKIRTTCDGGPSGPIGTMIKSIGNNSFGKTAEHQLPIDYCFANECPEDYRSFYGDGVSPIDHVYFRIEKRRPKAYHQPQLAAWITAHTRMVLRRAALLAPDDFLYADTDCIVFSRDMSGGLDIDPKRYGAWKIEEENEQYQLIAKKVYRSLDGATQRAKGMRESEITPEMWQQWAEGEAPEQNQLQLLGLLGVLQGGDMYRQQTRRGTAVKGK